MEEALNQLAGDMFRTFARFEYALKAAGFHEGDGAAKADWRAFAESVSGLFDNPADPRLKEAVEYVLRHPPKKQIIEEGALVWGEVAPDTDLQADLVLQYVRRVRNNLFHGGKFNGQWFEPERSELLLRHCLTILHACRNASAGVGQAYDN
jgi:hypothetical protein